MFPDHVRYLLRIQEEPREPASTVDDFRFQLNSLKHQRKKMTVLHDNRSSQQQAQGSKDGSILGNTEVIVSLVQVELVEVQVEDVDVQGSDGNVGYGIEIEVHWVIMKVFIDFKVAKSKNFMTDVITNTVIFTVYLLDSQMITDGRLESNKTSGRDEHLKTITI